MRNLTLLSGLLLLTSTFSAHAVHMGQISANSALGENLDARISLYGLGELSPATLAVEIRPDITEASGSAARRAAAAIVPSIVSTPSGYTYIQLDSSAAISEPVVQFRLRLGSPSVTMIKHYVLTLDPRAPPATATRTPATTVPVQTETMTYGPVRGGQTLFGILRERGLNVSNANVARVVAANPHAFVESSPDRLRVGVLLDLPGAAATASTAPIAGAMAAAPVPVPLVHADVETQIEPQPRAVADFGTTAWREGDRAVAERIQSLEEKFAAIRARYAEQGRVSAAAPDATAEPAPATPAATIDSAAPAAVSAPVKPTAVAVENPSPATPATAPTLATPPPVRQSSSSGPQGLSWAALTLLVGGAIAILTLLGYASRLLAVRGQRDRGHTSAVSDADLRDLIARKAEKRLQLEDEMKRVLDSRRAETNGNGDAVSAIERAAAAGDVEASIDEIESKIAHGFYAEAEQSLKDIIEATPANHRAKLRLAEVYYLNERKDEFVEIAADIYAHHRVDMDNADWQRVMRMGKIIAPDRPPFSGPIPVESNA